jgi:hypothetical protein
MGLLQLCADLLAPPSPIRLNGAMATDGNCFAFCLYYVVVPLSAKSASLSASRTMHNGTLHLFELRPAATLLAVT